MQWIKTVLLVAAFTSKVALATEFDITRFGATPNDQTDDTTSVEKALSECARAGGVDGMIIRGNTVTGKLVGNSNTNLLICDNIIRAGDKSGAVMQLGYTKGLTIRGNSILGADE